MTVMGLVLAAEQTTAIQLPAINVFNVAPFHEV